MKLSPGCGSMPGKAVRLNKSLYGLMQASRLFNKRLVQDLNIIRFEQCLRDPCVLRFMMGNEVIGMIVIHVDDILFAGLKRFAEYVLQELCNLLPTKNLGEVVSFWVAHSAATARLVLLRFLRRATSAVFSRGSKFVAPARSPRPPQTITGP
ncbi:unnamed protein product [Scytosiphon promiscuus]